MSLDGTYVCGALNSKLIIENANDADGTANGTFILDAISIPVQIHYHYSNNVGPYTNFWMAGNDDDPNEFVGGAGYTYAPMFDTITMAGGYPDQNTVVPFSGAYSRI